MININWLKGKDWHGGMTDGGPGHVGTVTAVMEDTDEGEIICTVMLYMYMYIYIMEIH